MSNRSWCSYRSYFVPIIAAENRWAAFPPPPPHLPLNPTDNSEIRHAGKGPLPQYRWVQRQIYRAFYCCNLYKVGTADGPVAQGIEQQPSKLKVAGSNPAGVANKNRGLAFQLGPV
jgi:hypothetical protein